MIEEALAVHRAVFERLNAELAPVPVRSFPVDEPRYVRIEALTGFDDNIYKNNESSTHNFTVNVFDSPEGGTESLNWTWDTMARVQDALRDFRVGGSKVEAQDYQAWTVPTSGLDVFHAQGFIRYRVQIGA